MLAGSWLQVPSHFLVHAPGYGWLFGAGPNNAAGNGQTYLACAFDIRAFKLYFKTQYERLPNLLLDLEAARAMKHIIHCLFSILLKPNKNEWKDILERMHRRRKKSSTIFCSQFKKDEWYEQLGGEAGPLADTIWPSHS